MNRTVNVPVAGFGSRPSAWNDGDDAGDDELPVKTLSREEAQALRQRMSFLSPWVVVAAQGVVGLLCCAVFGLVSQSGAMAWSSLYGVAAVSSGRVKP